MLPMRRYAILLVFLLPTASLWADEPKEKTILGAGTEEKFFSASIRNAELRRHQ